jgi:hypothetical protein
VKSREITSMIKSSQYIITAEVSQTPGKDTGGLQNED